MLSLPTQEAFGKQSGGIRKKPPVRLPWLLGNMLFNDWIPQQTRHLLQALRARTSASQQRQSVYAQRNRTVFVGRNLALRNHDGEPLDCQSDATAYFSFCQRFRNPAIALPLFCQVCLTKLPNAGLILRHSCRLTGSQEQHDHRTSECTDNRDEGPYRANA